MPMDKLSHHVQKTLTQVFVKIYTKETSPLWALSSHIERI